MDEREKAIRSCWGTLISDMNQPNVYGLITARYPVRLVSCWRKGSFARASSWARLPRTSPL